MNRFLSLFALFVLAVPVRADLIEYVKKPEPAFEWKLRKKTDYPQGTTFELHLVSQEWQKIKWEHALVIYQPKDVKPVDVMFLWITGGKPSLGNAALALELATKMKAPVAFLFDIPNQPLFDGKKEDALIAETFVQYLKTKDASWPLLFPMVKSVVKAMDAVQAFAKEEWKQPIKQFVVSGASKRGWTSWLTAATADPRVKAIAPLVIDALNMQEQMPHQVECFGKFSEQIADYVKRDLVPLPDTAEARNLWAWIDPWVYRDKLTQPKMIINGTNDPYWTQDALNLYWDDLKGDKWVLYVPNAGHGLDQQNSDGKKDKSRALTTLAAFARHQMTDKPMPKLLWKHEGNDVCTISVRCDPAPKATRLWMAESATRDFRKSKWTEKPAKLEKNTVRGECSCPNEGYRAFFAECDFEFDGLRYSLSTQLRVVGKK
jgi:PhoPQ-activated pathogenicity-related protein